jgi:MFS family permease
MTTEEDDENDAKEEVEEMTRQRRPLSRARRIGLVGFALLQNSLLGGLIYGWSSIDSTLLIAPESRGGAGVDPNLTSHIFSWGASVAMVSCFFLGIVLDLFGPRICSLVSCTTITAGCALLASSHDFLQLSIGFCVLSFGGPGICSSIIHIANLFPDTKNLVISCLSGSIALSFSILSVFDYLWQTYDFATFHSLFGYYALVAGALTLGSFLMYPDETYKEEDGMADDDETSLAENEEQKSDIETEETHLLVKTSLSQQSAAQSPTTVVSLRRVVSLSAIPEHTHHHGSHIQSFGTPSFMDHEPFDSFLRPYTRTESFMISKQVMASAKDDPDANMAISLKDQPFLKQLLSGTYIRSSILFWICTFVTNFYVSSLSTELADLDQYTDEVQHQLTRNFTLFMSAGCLCSPVVGFLIDSYGVEICTFLLLIFGQVQMVLVLFFDDYHSLMIVSFGFYTLFRSFLYPVFIASLTSRLGFKYFGMLLGIGFAISGLWQLLMGPLNDFVAGDCHVMASPDLSGEDDCFEGLWVSLHLFQLSVLLGLMIIPYLDHTSERAHELAVEEFKRRVHISPMYDPFSGSVVGLSMDDSMRSMSSH